MCNGRNIRRRVDGESTLFAIDFAGCGALIALGSADLHAEPVVLQDSTSARVDSCAANGGDVGLCLGAAEEGYGKCYGIDAHVDETASAEVEGEDVGCFSVQDVVVSATVGTVGERGAVNGPEPLLLVDHFAQQFVVGLVDMAVCLDEIHALLFRYPEQIIELGGSGCGRLLEQDVLLGLQHLLRLLVVQAVGGSDVNGLEVLVGSEVVQGGIEL